MAKGSNIGDSTAAYNSYVSYAANLLRVDATTRGKVFTLLQKVESSLIKELEKTDPTGVTHTTYQTARFKQLLKQVQAMLAQKYTEIKGVVLNDLRDLARAEVQVTAKLTNNYIGVDLLSTNLTPGFLNTLVSDTLILGAPSVDWWSRQSDSLQRSFTDQIRQGMAQGETLQQLSQRIRGTPTGRRVGYRISTGEQRFYTEYTGGVMDAQRRQVDALIRSSVQAVSQRARYETYAQNDDVVHGVEALVVLDNRTTEFCMALSGQQWTLEGEPIGDSVPWPGYPPYHFNCRTTLIPILKSWEDLASKDKKDIARQADKAGLSIDTVQSSMNGPVSGELNYEEWLATQPLTFQEELLGPTKFKLWKDGDITFRDLVDQSGNPLTVKELKDRFG